MTIENDAENETIITGLDLDSIAMDSNILNIKCVSV